MSILINDGVRVRLTRVPPIVALLIPRAVFFDSVIELYNRRTIGYSFDDIDWEIFSEVHGSKLRRLGGSPRRLLQGRDFGCFPQICVIFVRVLEIGPSVKKSC